MYENKDKMIPQTVYINFKKSCAFTAAPPDLQAPVLYPAFACFYDRLSRFPVGPLTARSVYNILQDTNGGHSPCMHSSWHSNVDVCTFILYDWLTVP